MTTFEFSGPVCGDAFVGRSDLLDAIGKAVRAQESGVVVVRGDVRSGKTSLLMQLQHRLKGQKDDKDRSLQFALLSCAAAAPEGRLLPALIRALQESLEGWAPTADPDPARQFLEAKIHRHEKQLHLVVLMDEAERLGEFSDAVHLLHLLPGLTGAPGVHFVAATRRPFTDVDWRHGQGPRAAVLLREAAGRWLRHELRPLSDAEALALLEKCGFRPDPAENVPRRLGRLTGNWPLLLQHAGWQLSVNGWTWRPNLAREVFHQVHPILGDLWKGDFTEDERRLLHRLAEGRPGRRQDLLVRQQLEGRGWLAPAPNGRPSPASALRRFVPEGWGGFLPPAGGAAVPELLQEFIRRQPAATDDAAGTTTTLDEQLTAAFRLARAEAAGARMRLMALAVFAGLTAGLAWRLLTPLAPALAADPTLLNVSAAAVALAVAAGLGQLFRWKLAPADPAEGDFRAGFLAHLESHLLVDGRPFPWGDRNVAEHARYRQAVGRLHAHGRKALEAFPGIPRVLPWTLFVQIALVLVLLGAALALAFGRPDLLSPRRPDPIEEAIWQRCIGRPPRP